jgi:hypothetical protein
MKGEVEQVREGGGRRLADGRLAELTQSYDRLIAEGLLAQPPAEVPEHVKKRRATCCGGWREERKRCCAS